MTRTPAKKKQGTESKSFRDPGSKSMRVPASISMRVPASISMRVHTKIWIEDSEGQLLLGEGRLKILKAIDRAGSLSAAARELGMSYRAVWGKVRTTEKRLGITLVDGETGGRQHGGAKLTENGRIFVAGFERFDKQARAAVNELGQQFLAELEFNEE